MPLKRTIRSLLDHAALSTALIPPRERALRSQLTILMYHRVLPDALWQGSPLPGLVMPLSAFEAQIASIARRYEVVTVSQGLNRLRVGARDEKPLLAITFDDGYDDNHTHAAPVLEARACKGTFYLVSGFVGKDIELWFDQAARWFHAASTSDVAKLAQAIGVAPSWPATTRPIVRTFMAYLKALSRDRRHLALQHMHSTPRTSVRRPEDHSMSLDDARDLLRRGHELGVHTHAHPLLTQENEASLETEILGSKRLLESALNAELRGFCYPNGDHDDRVVAAVKAAGFTYATTTKFGVNSANEANADPFRLRRLDMNSARFLKDGRHDEAMFRAELALMHPY